MALLKAKILALPALGIVAKSPERGTSEDL
jgi:hypothetical protein